jgi:HK97 family phage prohead protease
MSTVARKVISGIATKGPTPRTFWFRASDATIDRDGDTIDPAGWDLRNFLRAPVILWAHDHSIPAIGRALRAEVTDGALMLLVEFPPPGLHPLADTVHDLVMAGFIVSMSVGFRPTKYVRNDQRGGIDFLEQELIESSIVNCGSNPSALLQSRARGADDAAIAKWLGRGGGDRGVVLMVRDDDAPVLRAGARHSASDRRLIDEIHKNAVSLGSTCESITQGPQDSTDDEDDGKKVLIVSGDFAAASPSRRQRGEPFRDPRARGLFFDGDRTLLLAALGPVMRDEVKHACDAILPKIPEWVQRELARRRGRVD